MGQPSSNSSKIIKLLSVSTIVSPFFSNSNKTFCVFNGALYNTEELKKLFSLTLSSTNEAAVLVEMYELLGEKFTDYSPALLAGSGKQRSQHDNFRSSQRKTHLSPNQKTTAFNFQVGLSSSASANLRVANVV